MSTATKIEWTDATWNPTTGCTRVSAGCEHCYIERTPPMRANRRFEGPHIGASTKGGVQLHPDRLDQPLHWRKPRRVFVNSMSDLFHPDVPFSFIDEVFYVMRSARQHVFQVLTKRPRRMQTWAASTNARHDDILGGWDGANPIPNVWLGVSVENQEWADKRIPLLLQTSAAVRFLSCEPLLGPIDLESVPEDDHWASRDIAGIDWVIVGGESGPGARPMHPDWARSLRDQCVAAGVPFFFKQWGEWCHPSQLPPDVDGSGSFVDDFVKVGKKRAGRELDGRTWDEMPGAAA